MGLRSAWNSHWLLAEEVIRAHEEDLAGVSLECGQNSAGSLTC
jgi:hypothetical protein